MTAEEFERARRCSRAPAQRRPKAPPRRQPSRLRRGAAPAAVVEAAPGAEEPAPEPRLAEASRRRRTSAGAEEETDVTEISASHGQGAARPHGRGHDGLQARPRRRPPATSTPRGRCCARRASRGGQARRRATTEGIVGVIVSDGAGTIAGVGCETEPVSKNDAFHAYAERVLQAVHADGPDAVAALDEERPS